MGFIETNNSLLARYNSHPNFTPLGTILVESLVEIDKLSSITASMLTLASKQKKKWPLIPFRHKKTGKQERDSSYFR